MKFLMTYESVPNAAPPTPEQMAAIGKLTQEMIASGVVIMTGGLVRPTKGTKVSYHAGKFSVTDGPFPETKELIDGFALVEVALEGGSHRASSPLHGGCWRGPGRDPAGFRSGAAAPALKDGAHPACHGR